MFQQNNNYVIGVDGGGTKTVAALADLKGRILRVGRAGSSNPRNVGLTKAIENVAKAITMVLPKNKKVKIASIFVGLPAVEEEFKPKVKEIKKIISQRVKSKITIGSDQLAAFRSGVDKKDGIVLIAGTGCVAHGWQRQEEAKISGWGWLTDEGSGFWVGQKVLQAVFRDLDSQGPKTLLTKAVFRNLKIKKTNPNLLNKKIYSREIIKNVSSLSLVCDVVARQGDKTAPKILAEAGKELSLSVVLVIKKLNFSKKSFPLVLAGGMFKSNIILKVVKKEIKKIAPKVQFIRPKKESLQGVVRLALEHL